MNYKYTKLLITLTKFVDFSSNFIVPATGFGSLYCGDRHATKTVNVDVLSGEIKVLNLSKY